MNNHTPRWRDFLLVIALWTLAIYGLANLVSAPTSAANNP